MPPADIMSGDSDRLIGINRSVKCHDPVCQCRNRGCGSSELAARTPESWKIHRDGAQTTVCHALEHWRPNSAPIGAMKQQDDGAFVASSEVAGGNACHVNGLSFNFFHFMSFLTDEFFNIFGAKTDFRVMLAGRVDLRKHVFVSNSDTLGIDVDVSAGNVKERDHLGHILWHY